MYRFFPFGFIKIIIFVINPCDPYLRFVGAESCAKVCLDHLDQYILTSDQLLTQFAKVIATISIVQLSVVYIFCIKKDSSFFKKKVKTGLKWLR